MNGFLKVEEEEEEVEKEEEQETAEQSEITPGSGKHQQHEQLVRRVLK